MALGVGEGEKMKICAFIQMYNEVEKGNLERCLNNVSKFCNDIVIYDDASTDTSVEVAKSYTPHIIQGKEHDFLNETRHKKMLLDYLLKESGIEPEWIFWIDCDEIVSKQGVEGGIVELCKTEDKGSFDSFWFHNINLYRSECWYRVDNLFGEGWFNRLWRNNGKLKFDVKHGLHQNLFPMGLELQMRCDIDIIHYGLSTAEKIAKLYAIRKKLGVPNHMNGRKINEETLTLRPVNLSWFPQENMPKIWEGRPEPLGSEKWKELIDKYGN